MYGRRRRREGVTITAEQLAALRAGRSDLFGSEEEAAEAWKAHEAEIMARPTNPGTRCPGWWRWASPIPQPRYYGTGRTLYEAGLCAPEEKAALEKLWAQEVDQALEGAESARVYHSRLRHVPPALRPPWPGGQTKRDLAAGEERDVDPRRYLAEDGPRKSLLTG